MANTQRDEAEVLRARSIALRQEGLSRRQIRAGLNIGNNDLLNRLLAGEPPPGWTKRPNAKDALRERARELRLAGRTYGEIVAELGVSKSSVSLWVRDLPKPDHSARHAQVMAEARWKPHRRERELIRQQAHEAAAQELGRVTDRDLFVLGVGLYWSEGTKRKARHPRDRVVFVNSDPSMISVYLAWLSLLGVEKERLRFSVMIHESADSSSAEEYWASIVGAHPERFGKTTLKKHNPKTARHNVGADYQGCLVVRVRQGADLYRRIEGWWYGIVGAAANPGE